MSIRIPAPAKLNLFLNVTGRRADGFHLLDSLFAFPGLYDRVTVAQADGLSLSIEGEWAESLDPGTDNLALGAARLLRAEAGISAGAAISLEKSIPVAAGLGGGSADAAATLVALNSLWQLYLPIERLLPLALRLGADVPACLLGQPVLARGIGDELTPVPPLPAGGILLVNPRVPTPTPAVFRVFREMNPTIGTRAFAPLPERFADVPALAAAVALRGNALIPAAVHVSPPIADVLAVLRMLETACCTGLSGSGATCFALFETVEEAGGARSAIMQAHPGWWAWSGGWSEPRS